MKPHKEYYVRRGLPHWQPKGATFFITYRLFGSLPKAVIREIKEQYEAEKNSIRPDQYEELEKIRYRHHLNMDRGLEQLSNGPYWLRKKEVAQIVADSLHFCEKKWCDLWAYCIMPNHVHLLMTPLPDSLPLYEFMERHKSFTATTANRTLKRKGAFWAEGYYDHVVRNEKALLRIYHYILNNPVKAGFVKNWEDWRWTFGAWALEREGF